MIARKKPWARIICKRLSRDIDRCITMNIPTETKTPTTKNLLVIVPYCATMTAKSFLLAQYNILRYFKH